jgi:hypothetical protein
MLAVLSRTAPAAALGLGLLALSGCATVAWPPPPGSCIEAQRGRGKGATWVYEIQGTRIDRAHVESLVGTTPEAKALVRSFHARDTAAFAMVITGLPTTLVPVIVASETSKPLYALLALPGLATLIAGVVMAITADEPLRRAVVDFNTGAARTGSCPMASAWLLPRPAAPGAERAARVETDEASK